MAAGLTKNQWYSRMYYRIKATQSRLEKAGVRTVYENLQLCPDMTGISADIAFNISFKTSHASNGEDAAWQVITVFVNGKAERYGYMQQDGDFDKGIARIEQVWSDWVAK